MVKNFFKKYNLLDFKFYPSKLTNKTFSPRGVISSLFSCIVTINVSPADSPESFRSATWRARKHYVYWTFNWAPSSEFVSSSIPSWKILTAHAQPFRGARDLAFCLKVPLDSMLVRASSGGSGETARMRRLAWTFAARIGDKYQIRLTRSNLHSNFAVNPFFVTEPSVLNLISNPVEMKGLGSPVPHILLV